MAKEAWLKVKRERFREEAARNGHPGESRVEMWRPRDLQGIELHRGFRVTQDYPRHWHDEMYICAVTEGSSWLECGGHWLAMPQGTLAVVPAGEVHANEKSQCAFRCAFLSQSELQRTAEEFAERSMPAVNVRADLLEGARMTAMFLRLHRTLESPNTELALEDSLASFAHEFVARHSAAGAQAARAGREDHAVWRAKLFLEEHYARAVRLSELARLTRVSPFQLNRAFRQKVGMPPHAYQLQVRLARAKVFLGEGRPAAETATLAGFFDQSHFTHAFKRYEGMTPRQYLHGRKNLQDGKRHTSYVQADR